VGVDFKTEMGYYPEMYKPLTYGSLSLMFSIKKAFQRKAFICITNGKKIILK